MGLGQVGAAAAWDTITAFISLALLGVVIVSGQTALLLWPLTIGYALFALAAMPSMRRAGRGLAPDAASAPGDVWHLIAWNSHRPHREQRTHPVLDGVRVRQLRRRGGGHVRCGDRPGDPGLDARPGSEPGADPAGTPIGSRTIAPKRVADTPRHGGDDRHPARRLRCRRTGRTMARSTAVRSRVRRRGPVAAPAPRRRLPLLDRPHRLVVPHHLVADPARDDRSRHRFRAGRRRHGRRVGGAGRSGRGRASA